MKIERINENMIRVTVTLDDLEERNIDFDAMHTNSPAAQELFLDMMEQAEEQYGFNLSDSQLMIEPTEDDDDGFVITITRLDDDNDYESIHRYISNRMRKSDLKYKRRYKRASSARAMYTFRDIDDVCQLSKRIEDLYTGESTLFKYRDMYYLTMSKSDLLFSPDGISIQPIIGEYGNKVSDVNFFEGYLNEYGETIIASNALETLRQYF